MGGTTGTEGVVNLRDNGEGDGQGADLEGVADAVADGAGDALNSNSAALRARTYDRDLGDEIGFRATE